MKTIKKASLLFASLALVLGAGLVGNSDTKEVKAAITSDDESSLSVLTSENFDVSAEYVLKSTDGYYWNGESGSWGGITKTLTDVARVTINGTFADGFSIKDANSRYLKSTTKNMTWSTISGTTSPDTFKMGVDSKKNPILFAGTSNGLKVNGTSGMRIYANLTYNESSGKSVALYKIDTNSVRLTSTNVKTQPKVEYFEGASFNPTGLVITQHFSDGTTNDIEYLDENKDKFTFSPSLTDALATTDEFVTITYLDDTYGKSTIQLPITVNEDSVTSISIDDSSSFDGKIFALNGNWSTDGIIVKATRKSGAITTLENDDINLSFVFNPEIPNSIDLSNVDVTVSYKGIASSTTKTLSGFKVVESEEITYDFVNNFSIYASDWSNSYSSRKISNSDLDVTASTSILLTASKQGTGMSITDRPVFRGNKNNVIIDFDLQQTGYTILNVDITFAQWGTKTPTLSLYSGTYSNSASAVSSLTISSSKKVLSGNIDGNQFQVITSGGDQVGLTSIKVTAVKEASALDTTEKFLADWDTTIRGSEKGLCDFLSGANKTTLEALIARYNALEDANKAELVDKAGVKISESITYAQNVWKNIQTTEGNYGNSGVVITSNNSFDKTSLIALFAILGIVTISGYYIIEKKKFSK